MNKILIKIEGGLVTEVYADTETEVTIIDVDCYQIGDDPISKEQAEVLSLERLNKEIDIYLTEQA